MSRLNSLHNVFRYDVPNFKSKLHKVDDIRHSCRYLHAELSWSSFTLNEVQKAVKEEKVICLLRFCPHRVKVLLKVCSYHLNISHDSVLKYSSSSFAAMRCLDNILVCFQIRMFHVALYARALQIVACQHILLQQSMNVYQPAFYV